MKPSSRTLFICALILCASTLQADPLYLGAGGIITNTWDATTENWLADTTFPGATQAWVDGNDAVFPGATWPLRIFCGTNFTASVSNMTYIPGTGSINIYGVSNSVGESITFSGTVSCSNGVKQYTFRHIALGGTFTISNCSQFAMSIGSSFAPGTDITAYKRLQLIAADKSDYSDLTVTMVGANGAFRAGSTNKVVGSLSGTGEVGVNAGVNLTLNNTVIGTDGTIGTFSKVDSGSLVLGPGTHYFDINKSGSTNTADQITGDNVVAGGTLVVNRLPGSDALEAGDVFYLFSDGQSISGSFTDISLPALAGGLAWDTSLLPYSGALFVSDYFSWVPSSTIVDVSPAPSNTLKIVVDIPISWPTSVPEAYYPRRKTNLAPGAWSKIAHSDSFDGIFSKTNLGVATVEGADLAIYVKATNTAEFFRIDAQLDPWLP
jgi:hypothetical protein